MTLTTIIYYPRWSSVLFCLLSPKQSTWPGFLHSPGRASLSPQWLPERQGEGLVCSVFPLMCRLGPPALPGVCPCGLHIPGCRMRTAGQDLHLGTGPRAVMMVGFLRSPWSHGWVPSLLAHLPVLCLAEEPTFRCDECDELFQCKLDLRRHKKYACGSTGATLYEGLGEELKPDGLGSGGSDGQAHECKDCERMFPNKYRCRPCLSSRTSSTPPCSLAHHPVRLGLQRPRAPECTPLSPSTHQEHIPQPTCPALGGIANT